MKYLLLVPFALLFSCKDSALSKVPVNVNTGFEYEEPEQPKDAELRSIYINSFSSIDFIEIDGCEYLIYNGYREGNIIHKANCKNHN